jgi:hypothetical protein
MRPEGSALGVLSWGAGVLNNMGISGWTLAIQNHSDILVTQRSSSPLSALQAGGLIEEVDMQDLNDIIATINNGDLIRARMRLQCGS